MRSMSPERMDEIQDIVNTFFFREHRMPSVKEIADRVGMAKSSVHRYLTEMDRRGILSYRAGEILTRMIDGLSFSFRNTPILGGIECGEPVLENEYTEDFVPLPTTIFGDREMFILRARGESMVNAGIASGDLVVISRQQTAKPGDIVAALVDHRDSTLKRLMYDKERDRQYLHPENEGFEDMYFDEIEIQGVLSGIIKQGPF